MPGKRRDFAGSFALEEVDFWLTDPRIRACPAPTKVFFQYTWMIAVKERRAVLPHYWDTHAIGKASQVDPKTARKSFLKLKEKSLLGETADGRIIVYGVTDKHPNLKWKDGDISKDLRPHSVAQSESESESESEKSKSKTSTKSSGKPDQDLSQHQKDIRDLTETWASHFTRNGKGPPTPAFLGKVIVSCRRVGVSPDWLIRKIKPDHANPQAMILFFFKPGESLPGSDDERHANTYAAWEKRGRSGTLVGDVLKGMTDGR